MHHNWTGLLVDGDEQNIEHATNFYGRSRHTFLYPPRIVHEWVTAENVNRIISRNGFSGEVDLLSLDLDGVDYWIWQAIDVVSPRVVVLEYNSGLGPERSITVPYKEDFRKDTETSDYCGASLAAFVKLGRTKGYRLVGRNRHFFNAFFIRDGIEEGILPEISAESCFEHPLLNEEIPLRWQNNAGNNWVEV